MKILLTGANGFLGKYIDSYFQKHHILETLGRSTGCNYICDLANEVPVLSNNFDVVIHAAGKAHLIPRSQDEVDDFFRVNHQGTVHLLQALENQLLTTFIYISTVAVYGLLEGVNISETSSLNATDPYGRSKILAEAAVMEWCNIHNVPCIIFRLPLVIGINAPGNLGDMVRGIRNGIYFEILNSKARKSMVLACDIPKAIENAIGKSGIFNLTDGYHPTFKELSSLIANQANRKVYSIPYWVAAIAAKFGDLLGNNAPINSNKLKKITSSLTFDDSYARQILNWIPGNVLEYYKIK